ncbi:hypothetical protein EAH_00036140 [Eimeria acervulina]|uniref:Uncharacterized protein n=1 Tax=Eimeria acervulina TaxID=5801 RepID=U6GUU2_EIMAC|nr:hypothetical protein EAH_00036140 [Eimeria acervulina]CDI83342.1 hypothetical protein EAH_00036140 [Eimeria acervulina]
MLVSAVLDALFVRLEQLTRMEWFAADTEVIHLGTAGDALWMSAMETEESTAKFGRDSNGKERVDNLYISPSVLPFPVTRFAEALNRSSVKAEARRISTSKIRRWQPHWHPSGLQKAIASERTSIIGSPFLQTHERHAALSGWFDAEDTPARLAHPFEIAICLL